jgi:UDP-N-acetyl-D-mannosaminuronic acid dehydrogenase
LPATLAKGAGVRLTADMHEAVREADVVVMLVNHRLYQTIARDELAGKTVIDTRGIWS